MFYFLLRQQRFFTFVGVIDCTAITISEKKLAFTLFVFPLLVLVTFTSIYWRHHLVNLSIFILLILLLFFFTTVISADLLIIIFVYSIVTQEFIGFSRVIHLLVLLLISLLLLLVLMCTSSLRHLCIIFHIIIFTLYYWIFLFMFSHFIFIDTIITN